MSADTDMTPEEIVSALAGDAGDEAQFTAMKTYIPQYVARAMSMVRMSGGAGVAVHEGLNQIMIYEP